MSFSGFTKEAPRFLFENRTVNSKEWYDSHKSEYKKYVYEPFVELVRELAPVMTEIDEKFITVPSKLISRVRRDTRFTKDKSLYRDNAWLVFLRDKTYMSITPCYWFEINQEGSSHGVGYYKAKPETMSRMRDLILSGHPSFRSALKCYESQDKFRIGGEKYKRSKFTDKPDNIKSWLVRKNIYFECVVKGYSLAFSKELPDILKEDFRMLKPIYEFFLTAESTQETS
ncbi:MAG: DUF2461 domain-containing protein [Acetivibrionales bacterium]|jgi:uncharacterized protein (TIGR02453 family)